MRRADSTKTMKAMSPTRMATIAMTPMTANVSPLLHLAEHLLTPLGRPMTMPAKISSEMPLPMPRSVICSPSHITKMVPVVSVIIVVRMKPQPFGADRVGLEPVGDDEGLEHAQHDRQVAGALVDLLAAHLALLLQLLELREDGRHQLQ